MNLSSTKHYSVGSTRTIIDDFQMESNPMKYTQEMKQHGEKEFYLAQQMKAKRAMEMLNQLIEQGFYENEAWEIVSKEIVYRY